MTKGKMDPRILAVNAILGDTVRNKRGELLGTITDLMIDLRSGQVIYAYVSFGSFGESSDIADKLFAVPFSALELQPDQQSFQLDVDEQKLARAHGFDKNSLPDLTNRAWQAEVHELFGSSPYWENPWNYQG